MTYVRLLSITSLIAIHFCSAPVFSADEPMKVVQSVRDAVGDALKEDVDPVEPYWKIEGKTLYYVFYDKDHTLASYEFRDAAVTIAALEYMKTRKNKDYAKARDVFDELNALASKQVTAAQNKNQPELLRLRDEKKKIIQRAVKTVASASGLKAEEGWTYRDRVSEIVFYKTQIKTDPPGGRRFFLTAFEYAYLKKLDLLKDITQWHESLVDTELMTGFYYFRAKFGENDFRDYGKQQIAKNGTVTLPKK